MATNNNNTASIGFEQQIWAAADILRGNMDAAEYKHVVLGLIFLKYISDKFATWTPPNTSTSCWDLSS